jgi:lipoate-protein ligase A
VRETLQSEWGLEARLHEACDAEIPAREPFLCFQRRAAGDLVLGGHKIGGSAQRRRKGAVLQHGSILFERSPAAPELAGISDLANIPGLISHFNEPWLARLSVALGLDFQPAALTHALVERSNALVTEKYGNPAWIARK